jgi:hypothetical protein
VGEVTKIITFVLVAALSQPTWGQDSTADRVRRLEDTMELTLRVNQRIAAELERLDNENRLPKILVKSLIEEVHDLKQERGK